MNRYDKIKEASKEVVRQFWEVIKQLSKESHKFMFEDNECWVMIVYWIWYSEFRKEFDKLEEEIEENDWEYDEFYNTLKDRIKIINKEAKIEFTNFYRH